MLSEIFSDYDELLLQFKERLGIGKEESSTDSLKQDAEANSGNTGSSSAEGKSQQSGSSNDSETMFNKFKSSTFSTSPKVCSAFERLKNAKVVDLAKKGYDILKEELNGTPTNRKKHMEPAAPPETGERSTRTDVVIVPSKQSKWSKKWDALKAKVRTVYLNRYVSFAFSFLEIVQKMQICSLKFELFSVKP